MAAVPCWAALVPVRVSVPLVGSLAVTVIGKAWAPAGTVAVASLAIGGVPMAKLAVALADFGSGRPLVRPSSVIVYWKLALPVKLVVGVKTGLPFTRVTVPPMGLLTAVMVML